MSGFLAMAAVVLAAIEEKTTTISIKRG